MVEPAQRRDELRCSTGVLFGVLRGPGRPRPDDPEGATTLTVKCRSRWCGHAPGVVVEHVFDIDTGKVLRSYRFRDTEGPTGPDGKRGKRT